MPSYALTFVTYLRRPTLLRTANAHLLLDTLFHYRDAGRYALHGFAIMPEHLHVILTPAGDQAIERCAQSITSGFSHRLRSSLPAWQAGFHEHCIRDGEDFDRQLAYIADNPDRRRLKNHLYVHTNFIFKMDPIPLSLEAPSSLTSAPLNAGWVCKPAVKAPSRRKRSSPQLRQVIRRLTHLTLAQAALKMATRPDPEEPTLSEPPY